MLVAAVSTPRACSHLAPQTFVLTGFPLFCFVQAAPDDAVRREGSARQAAGIYGDARVIFGESSNKATCSQVHSGRVLFVAIRGLGARLFGSSAPVPPAAGSAALLARKMIPDVIHTFRCFWRRAARAASFWPACAAAAAAAVDCKSCT